MDCALIDAWQLRNHAQLPAQAPYSIKVGGRCNRRSGCTRSAQEFSLQAAPCVPDSPQLELVLYALSRLTELDFADEESEACSVLDTLWQCTTLTRRSARLLSTPKKSNSTSGQACTGANMCRQRAGKTSEGDASLYLPDHSPSSSARLAKPST
jgi:hypothetical protein